ncbi:MAG: hypothetical protein EBU08_09620 [Micrococcales bacterium]|nr:hypothetical protein [Micrococcales bacterium]
MPELCVGVGCCAVFQLTLDLVFPLSTRNGVKLYQIEGMLSLEQMKKDHPFTISGILTEEESLLALVGPNAENQTWTAMISIKRNDTESWSTRAFLWCHMDPMGVLYEKWGVDVEPPFEWQRMKQAPGRGLEWQIEERGGDMNDALDKTLTSIGKCRMGTRLALAHLKAEAIRLNSSRIGLN